MSEKAPCIRCARNIDAWAKICPFCNWDQSVAPPAVEPPKPAAVADYRPPEEFDLKKKAWLAGGGVLALVAAFGIGMVINQDGAPKSAPKTVEEQVADEEAARRTPSAMRANTPLVPVDEAGGIEQPITSAPVSVAPGVMPNDYQRTDATAVSATEYAEMAKRAQAEKQRQAQAVDPRTLTGPAYTPRRVPPPSQHSGAQNTVARRSAGPIRTRPVPQSQPLPHIAGAGTARLSLTIGADGRVKDINIEKPLRRNTAQLLSAVASWRFKPATINGHPVAAPYSVEISFKE